MRFNRIAGKRLSEDLSVRQIRGLDSIRIKSAAAMLASTGYLLLNLDEAKKLRDWLDRAIPTSQDRIA